MKDLTVRVRRFDRQAASLDRGFHPVQRSGTAGDPECRRGEQRPRPAYGSVGRGEQDDRGGCGHEGRGGRRHRGGTGERQERDEERGEQRERGRDAPAHRLPGGCGRGGYHRSRAMAARAAVLMSLL